MLPAPGNGNFSVLFYFSGEGRVCLIGRMTHVSNWFRNQLVGALFLLCAILAGGSANGATITVSGSFQITAIDTSLGPGQVAVGDRFSFTLMLDGAVLGGGQPNFPATDYVFKNVVTTAVITRDPNNTGVFNPGSLSLVGGEIECVLSDTQQAVGITAFFSGFGPIEGEERFALSAVLIASAGTFLDGTRPPNTSLQDLWSIPTSLENLDALSYTTLGRTYRSDTTGTFSTLVAIPEPGAVTMLLGSGVAALLSRRRSFQM